MTPHGRGKGIYWYDSVGNVSKGLLKKIVCNKKVNFHTDGVNKVTL